MHHDSLHIESEQLKMYFISLNVKIDLHLNNGAERIFKNTTSDNMDNIF